jgi:hypothetical protein
MADQVKTVVERLRHIRARSLGGWVMIGAALLFVVLVGLAASNSVAFHSLEGKTAEVHQTYEQVNDAVLGISVIGFAFCLIVGSILLSGTDRPIAGSENVPLLAADLKSK